MTKSIILSYNKSMTDIMLLLDIIALAVVTLLYCCQPMFSVTNHRLKPVSAAEVRSPFYLGTLLLRMDALQRPEIASR